MKKEILSLANINKFSPNFDIKNGCALAVGSFDGVHIGHREMLMLLVAEAKRLSVPAVVFTFSADDNPKTASNKLCNTEKQNEIFGLLGVDAVVCVAFSTIKDMSALDFTEALRDEFGVKSVICGYDFRFGKKRSGDVETMKEILSPSGVNVVTQNAVCVDDVPVSSTLIRKLISDGRIDAANSLLSRAFSIKGEIVHGARLATSLGFPTANIVFPENIVLPKFGVYATYITLDGKKYRGVTNVGIKPTFMNTEVPLCETNLIGFDGDCYGKIAEVEFVGFLRHEIKFASKEELTAQIEKDKIKAFEILTEGSLAN